MPLITEKPLGGFTKISVAVRTALYIRNPEIEWLASEAARLGGTTKTEAIRQALLDGGRD
jgi:hypothetical protein